MPKTSQLSAQQISVGYGDKPILQDLSFDLPAGELTVIVGPNACGKSTLLKTLARLLTPSRGQVTLDGQDLRDLKPKTIARSLALLPQSPRAPEASRVADIVALGRYPYQGFFTRQSSQDQDICRQAMAACRVLELADRPLEALSGGQRQRVWIAMTLAQETPLILLDEPTTYLDISHQIEVLNLAAQLHAQGRTLALVLHDLNLAFRYATHLVMMRQGKILAQGRPSQIVTPESIKEVFDLDVLVEQDPITSAPMIIPHREQSREAKKP